MASKQHTSIFDKLCDSSLYTGAHKHRFDQNGNGRGLSGRDRVAKGHGHIAGAPSGACYDLSQITRPNLHTTGAGYRPPSSSAYRPPSGSGSALLYTTRTSNDGARTTYTGPVSPSTPTPARPASVGRNALRTSYTGSPSITSPTGASATTRTSYTGSQDTARRSGGGGSIFDRLSDVSSYTGMHRQRFSSDGRGRGAVGRTTPNAYVAAADLMRRNC